LNKRDVIDTQRCRISSRRVKNATEKMMWWGQWFSANQRYVVGSKESRVWETLKTNNFMFYGNISGFLY